MTIGPKTKDAIKRIAEHLPYLFSDGAAAPTHTSEAIGEIRAKYATKQPNGPRDTRIEAANEWAEEQLTKALEEDNKAEAKPETKHAKVEHGGVVTDESETAKSSKKEAK